MRDLPDPDALRHMLDGIEHTEGFGPHEQEDAHQDDGEEALQDVEDARRMTHLPTGTRSGHATRAGPLAGAPAPPVGVCRDTGPGV